MRANNRSTDLKLVDLSALKHKKNGVLDVIVYYMERNTAELNLYGPTNSVRGAWSRDKMDGIVTELV